MLVGLQRRLIYFPFPAQVPGVEAVVAGAREVRLRTVDSLALGAWLVEAGEPDRGVAVLVANGNAGNRSLRAPLARALASAGPSMKIWPGIDVDIPTAATSKKTQPDDVYQAVKAAFEAGAHGVILSRKYSEMRLDNLRAAGRAVRELGVA